MHRCFGRGGAAGHPAGAAAATQVLWLRKESCCSQQRIANWCTNNDSKMQARVDGCPGGAAAAALVGALPGSRSTAAVMKTERVLCKDDLPMAAQAIVAGHRAGVNFYGWVLMPAVAQCSLPVSTNYNSDFGCTAGCCAAAQQWASFPLSGSWRPTYTSRLTCRLPQASLFSI